MEKLRQEIETKIKELKVKESGLLKSSDVDYSDLMIISAKITAFYEALNLTYAD